MMCSTGHHVLVIDDDPGTREFLASALETEGYAVQTAPNGLAGLSVAETWHPDLILLDLNMPVMAGWEFLMQYRMRPGPHAPVIASSGTPRFREPALAAGAVAFVAKPYEIDDLFAAVARQVANA